MSSPLGREVRLRHSSLITPADGQKSVCVFESECRGRMGGQRAKTSKQTWQVGGGVKANRDKRCSISVRQCVEDKGEGGDVGGPASLRNVTSGRSGRGPSLGHTAVSDGR